MISEALQRPIGPLAAWQWGVVVGGGYLGYRVLRGRSSGGAKGTNPPLGDPGFTQGPSGPDGPPGPKGDPGTGKGGGGQADPTTPIWQNNSLGIHDPIPTPTATSSINPPGTTQTKTIIQAIAPSTVAARPAATVSNQNVPSTTHAIAAQTPVRRPISQGGLLTGGAANGLSSQEIAYINRRPARPTAVTVKNGGWGTAANQAKHRKAKPSRSAPHKPVVRSNLPTTTRRVAY